MFFFIQTAFSQFSPSQLKRWIANLFCSNNLKKFQNFPIFSFPKHFDLFFSNIFRFLISVFEIDLNLMNRSIVQPFLKPHEKVYLKRPFIINLFLPLLKFNGCIDSKVTGFYLLRIHISSHFQHCISQMLKK